MKWIYLSPHFDDAVLSCGGMIYEQVQAGLAVEIWTIFAGNPPVGPLPPFALTMHRQWETGLNAVGIRRKEDVAAVSSLGAIPRHFEHPDCIYRSLPENGLPVIQERDDLFKSSLPAEQPLVDQIVADLTGLIRPDDLVVAPLTIGGHCDHRLTRAAAQALHRPVWFYTDYPYTVQPEFSTPLEQWVGADWQMVEQQVSDAGLRAWQNAILHYASQLSTFWKNEAEMRRALADYRAQGGGEKLYSPV
jgi:LmbE family N-acetylglucosaminyl deacetylase